jgi:hypothetical protein
MNLVIPVRKGGLGNQMFQVAAALVYKEETGKTVVLPREQKHIHRVHLNLYEDSIFQGFDMINKSLDDNAIYQLCQNGFTLYPGEPGFEAWKPILYEGGVLLHGYFQHYEMIEKHKKIIVNTYLKNLESYKETGDKTSIGIHVRRGDYLKFADVFSILDCSYYGRAIQEIEKQVPGPKVYKIFSEDLDWCKEQDMFQSLPNVEFMDEKDEIKSLCQMIACEGGFVCANSSFSWWAAFLGAFQKKSPCIVPENWMKGFTGELIPSSWIRIPAVKGSLQIYEPGTLNLHNKKDIENLIQPLQQTVELYVDSLSYSGSSNYKIFLQLEPTVIQNLEDHLLKNGDKYDKIFTYHQTILDRRPNAVKSILPACSWISGNQFHRIDTTKKQFQISCITGFKQLAEGHSFRLLLYFNQQSLIKDCKIPMTFYRSSAGNPLPEITVNPFIQKDKFPLFETYQYSFIIENSSQTNYFTEKLIDCLITKTIPIYYGCPNISEYFDTTGWILLTAPTAEGRIHEFLSKWQGYTEHSYQQFSQTIEANYKKCVELYPGFYNTLNKLFLELDAFA